MTSSKLESIYHQKQQEIEDLYLPRTTIRLVDLSKEELLAHIFLVHTQRLLDDPLQEIHLDTLNLVNDITRDIKSLTDKMGGKHA